MVLHDCSTMVQNFMSDVRMNFLEASDPHFKAHNLLFTFLNGLTTATEVGFFQRNHYAWPYTCSGIYDQETIPAARTVEQDNTPQSLAENMRWSVYPNPTSDQLRVDYWLEQPSEVQIVLYDMQGRMVYQSIPQSQAAGHQQWQWQLQDRQGGPLAAGTYRLLLVHGRGQQSTNVVVVP